jgi:hypothetical protein
LGIIVRRWVLPVTIFAVVLGMAACSDQTGGSPVAGGSATGSDPTGTSGQTTTSGNTSGGSITDLDPCALLNSAARGQLGLTDSGEPDDVGTAKGCKWRLRGPSETWTFTVDLRDSGGIKDLPPENNPKPIADVGSHKAVQLAEVGGPGACSVVLGVTDSSAATASVLAGTNTQKACDLALQMAKLVEPGLPRG